jgi:cell division protein FtsN
MARQDYAQKRRGGSSASRKAPSRSRKPAPPPRRPWGLALVSLAALGGLGVLIYLLLQTPPNGAAGTPAASTPAAKAAPASTPVTASKPKPTPAPESTPTAGGDGERFEFYDMLPKSTVETPEVSAYKSTPKTAKLETRVLLQAGSFRNAADAEEMRARMILAGLPNVSTSRTEGSNGVWYRVRTGPFDTRAEVNLATNKLYELNIHPLEIRAD